MRPLALIANPSPDLYGADLQMLRTVGALRADGWDVTVALPEDGPLSQRIRALGAEVIFVHFPVLRKSELSGGGAVRLSLKAVKAVVRIRRLILRRKPAVVIVNTITLPWWIIAARLSLTRVICHMHEAETGINRLVQVGLLSPLLLASTVVVISKASMDAMMRAIPQLRGRSHLVYNGVSGPAGLPQPGVPTTHPRLLVIGRLSPRKAPDLVLEAASQLRQRGYDVEVELAGTPFAGYEWYEEQLRKRAKEPDLLGHVIFAGYTSPIWPTLEKSSIVVQPSQFEPFGLAVVEAQFALRPVVASAALGHLETIENEKTGLLSTPGDAASIADCVARLLDAPELVDELTQQALASASTQFSVERYSREIALLVREIARL